MNVSDERTVALWAATEVAPDAVPLGQSEQVDVVVVGSGIAGLSVAYELAAAGQKVAVVDRGRIGSGMTARTTAHLSSVCDDYFSELIKLRGEDLARIFIKANRPLSTASNQSRRRRVSRAISDASTAFSFRLPAAENPISSASWTPL